MAGSNSQYSILVDVQLQEESIKKQLKEIQNNKDTKLKIGVTADGTERTKKELDGVTQSTKNLDNSTKDLMFTYQRKLKKNLVKMCLITKTSTQDYLKIKMLFLYN